MGIFHKKACENLLRDSKSMRKIDMTVKEDAKDRKTIYSVKSKPTISTEKLFNENLDTKSKGGTPSILLIAGIGAGILFVVVMVLLLVL